MRAPSERFDVINWSAPPNLAIYLSTIELPDLKPGRREQLGGSSGKVSPEPPRATIETRGSGSSKDGGIGRLFRTRS